MCPVLVTDSSNPPALPQTSQRSQWRVRCAHEARAGMLHAWALPNRHTSLWTGASWWEVR